MMKHEKEDEYDELTDMHDKEYGTRVPKPLVPKRGTAGCKEGSRWEPQRVQRPRAVTSDDLGPTG